MTPTPVPVQWGGGLGSQLTTPTVPAESVGTPRLKRCCDPDTYECDDFDSWREANEFFIAAGGPEKDPYGMDPDADGIPCEALR